MKPTLPQYDILSLVQLMQSVTNKKVSQSSQYLMNIASSLNHLITAALIRLQTRITGFKSHWALHCHRA